MRGSTQYADSIRFQHCGDKHLFAVAVMVSMCGGVLVTPNVGANNITIATGMAAGLPPTIPATTPFAM
jgi:hypothetical protein